MPGPVRTAFGKKTYSRDSSYMNSYDSSRDTGWSGYVGELLRGQQPINQLLPTHPYIDTLPQMEKVLEKNTQYFMLLTIEEARGVLSDLIGQTDNFLSYKIGAGSFKDIWDGAYNSSRFSTYLNEANQFRFNLKSIGITAKTCRYGGVTYIKITGYPSLRRILNGTRYRANNLQLLELGIGWRGLGYNLYQGAKFCVYFSLAFRAVELIFKNEYTLVDFFGDIIADAAKTLISIVVAGVAGLILLGAPVILTTIALIIIGLATNSTLNKYDELHGWSVELKNRIKEAFYEEQRINEWNNIHTSTGMLPPGSFNY